MEPRDGWNTIVYTVKGLKKNTYFRLRGTNNPLGSPEIDLASPNSDPALNARGNTAAAAWKDLWFYSNPIVVSVQ